MKLILIKKLIATGVLALIGHGVFAANVLYVANGNNSEDEPSAATALTSAGHTVTEVYNDLSTGENVALQGDLSPYGAVVWGASDNNKPPFTSAATIASLTSYVSNGGYLYITGYDSVASPDDPLLADFIGGASNVGIEDDVPAFGVISAANSLTTGILNLVGMTPADLDDQDALNLSDFGSGAVGVSCNGNRCGWVYRELGAGAIAYVSTDGESYGDYTDSDPADPYYAYHYALLNFVSNAPVYTSFEPQSVPIMSAWGLGILAGLLGFIGFRKRVK